MATFAFLSPLLVGITLGVAACWLVFRNAARHAGDAASARAAAESSGLQATLEQVKTQLSGTEEKYVTATDHIQQLTVENATVNAQLAAEKASLQRERAAFDKQLDDVKLVFEKSASEILKETSAALKNDIQVKHEDSAKFIDEKQKSIDALVEPLRTSLRQIESHSKDLERARIGAYSDIKVKIDEVVRINADLQREASKLTTALSSPVTSGDWGEHLLTQVVTLAGMTEKCHFDHQVKSKDGSYRPDMIIELPNGRKIIVDSKTSVKTFLEAYGTLDEKIRKEKLNEHCKKLRSQIALLSKNQYEQQFENALDLVVCFIPGDVFHVAALSVDRDLWEFAATQKVLLATPTTLLGLLKAVAYGWQQDAISRDALHVKKLGQELYSRLTTAIGHMAKLQKSIDGTVQHWDALVGSFQSSVFPAARRMRSLGGILGNELSEVTEIDARPRLITLPETGSVHTIAAMDGDEGDI